MINVTQPLLPPMEEFIPLLKDIWNKKWLTNNGEYHQKLEQALCDYLKVEHISLFTNGTLPLIVALQSLCIKGEVITTPYSFVATTHSLWWNGITPVFVDVEPNTGNLDPDKIEAAITNKTTAIMPVHVYGTPCNVERIQNIADKYGLKVIYDAAHAFGVEVNGKSILEYGDMSTLSFHATKTYNTIEGGALICKDAKTKQRIDYLKNFGIADEVTVVAPGINGKLDELRAAYGLIQIKHINNAINSRKKISDNYRKALSNVPGISFLKEINNVRMNYSYFPIFIDKSKYYCSRDELYDTMKEKGILARKYFFPLISDFPTYRGLSSASKENLPVASKLADTVLCLPLHHELTEEEFNSIINIIIT